MIISLLDDVKPTQLEFGGCSHGFTIRDISGADMRKILRIVAIPILQESNITIDKIILIALFI